MQHIAPLIQTGLWVSLIIGALWRFHLPLHGLLTALQKRIEGGSSIKAGPFELTELRPQDPTVQKEKVASEIHGQGQAEALPATASGTGTVGAVSVEAMYFQAEDLALRAIQTECGVPISRQVTAGRDPGFDGIFLSGGRTTVVEVKYVPRRPSLPRGIQTSIERITAAVQQYQWRESQILLAFVFEESEAIEMIREKASLMFSKNPVPVVVRCYTIGELRARFGLGVHDVR